ncbi:MAG: adenylate/guanylate cyclase domain-containing protein [Capsulimonadales bacterium]|nr:adenylate/guanylate cyclase domain-containing protein [Capsulimonadales bacterium]
MPIFPNDSSARYVPPPTGVVTHVFTDMVGSSALSETYGDAFESVRLEHFRLLRADLRRFGGYEVKTTGDGIHLTFAGAADAVRWAVATQQALLAYPWPNPIDQVLVRMGMYTGESPLMEDNGRPDYAGPAPNRAARVAGAAHGGQILLSDSTRILVEKDLIREGIRFADLGTHRLKGIGEVHLHQVLAEGLPERFPPPATLGVVRHNLPLPLTPFVGREDDVLALTDLLSQGKRLITLLGFGGIGKTRTALQVAELCSEVFPGGVWWCDLAQAQTRDALMQKVAVDLRLDLQPPPSARERVFAWLRERRRTLLALDNLEQVADGEEAILELIRGLPDLVCLVTSRRRLGLEAETVYELQPFPLPTAVVFFVERARARQPNFTRNAENEADIMTLCQRLEGVPLALELAAARITALTPRQMVQRLNERFRLLQARLPDLPERQRALRTTIEWSYQLLTEDQRALFAQLSVFTGAGFTLDDAEAVCDSPDVFEDTQTLRDHSLLRTEIESQTQTTRYSLPESLREYAAERLREQGAEAADAVRRRHALHFLARAGDDLSRLRTADEGGALRALESVSADLHEAELWAGQRREGAIPVPDLHGHLCLSLGLLFFRLGFPQQALHYIRNGLASVAPADPGPDNLRRRLNREAAGLYLDISQIEQARQCLNEARSQAAMADADEGSADEENLFGQIALAEKDFPAARAYFRRALEIRRAIGASPVGDAILLNNLGLTEYQDPNGNTPLGISLLKEALAIRERAGDVRGMAATRNNLGNFAFAAQDWTEAARCYAIALDCERRLRHPFGVALALNNYGEAIEQSGESERALLCYAVAAHLFRESGSPYADFCENNFTRLAASRNLSPDDRERIRRQTQGKNLERLCSVALSQP